ncbi:MAG: hypothetical protein EPO37_04175 [Nitrosarchaeum sp.]|nr:MAG: hypothetical protein EPO37_04175 [Nitrosarchaeum sp.]
MKNTITIVVVAAIVATSAGFLGFSFASNQSSPNQPLITSAMMNGHIQLVVTDSDGQIKAYRQTDNAITTKAENCVAKILFKGPSSGTGNGCTGALNSPFTYIAVGTGTGSESNTNTELGTELATSGLTRALATTVTITNSTTGGTGSSAASVLVSKAFSVSGTQSITEAGLFNETAASGTDAMFARKVFSAVSVANGDTLTVQWTINIGNTTSFN